LPSHICREAPNVWLACRAPLSLWHRIARFSFHRSLPLQNLHGRCHGPTIASVAAAPPQRASPPPLPSLFPPPPFFPQDIPSLPIEVKGRILCARSAGNDDDVAGASGQTDQWSLFTNLPVLKAGGLRVRQKRRPHGEASQRGAARTHVRGLGSGLIESSSSSGC
jgi:hypothetical protein